MKDHTQWVLSCPGYPERFSIVRPSNNPENELKRLVIIAFLGFFSFDFFDSGFNCTGEQLIKFQKKPDAFKWHPAYSFFQLKTIAYFSFNTHYFGSNSYCCQFLFEELETIH